VSGSTRRHLEWLAVATLAGLFVWKGLLVGWAALNTDFPNYYLGGRLFRGGWPLERLNDWIWMQRQKDHAGLDQALVGYLPSTLWSTLIIVPLTWLPPLAAKRVWLVFNLLLLLGVLHLLRYLTRLPYRRIALVTLLAIVPLRTNFQFGQQHLVVLFLMTLAAWAYFRGRPTWSGVLLALAAALKLYPALFALFFWRKRQWRALLGLIAATVGVVALGVELFGLESLRSYAFRILPRSLKGEYNDPYLVNLNSFTALLRRLFVAEPELNPHPFIHAPLVFVAIQPIAQAAVLLAGLWAIDRGRSQPGKQKLDWAAFCVLLFLLSTGASSYHLCALILPAALAVDYFAETGHEKGAWMVAASFALVCFPYGRRLISAAPSGWKILLGFPRLYALFALWAIVASAAWRARAGRDGARPRRERAIWALSFAAWAGISLLSSVRHFDGQFANYGARLDVGGGALIATTPTTVAGEVYFTRMVEAGYVVDRIGRSIAVDVPRGTDLFFPTGTAASRDGWIELASNISRVVRFPRGRDHLDSTDLVVEVEDAEQPAISPDARWLGFIRERRGRGGLWVVDRSAMLSGEASRGRERQLLDAAEDVLDFSFLPDDRIVTATFRDGTSRLSLIDPASGQQVGLETSPRPARYPAPSPDGRWIAYAEESHGQWQLWTMSLGGDEKHQLTRADCNSVMPSWTSDSKSLVYASDCSRGIGHTTLCEIAARPASSIH
jgi:hypothetical protein